MNAVFNLKETTNPFLLKGVVLKTGPRDHFPIEQAQLEQWAPSGRWVRFGKLESAQG